MKKSAGILLYRYRQQPEFFLVHPGGPFWKNKDEGAWSIPKGEYLDEDPEKAARREFEEETGQVLQCELRLLGTAKLKSGKQIVAFVGTQEVDETRIVSNTFPLEWPPHSGKIIHVPEVDKAAWFRFEEAQVKIHPPQLVFLETLRQII